jgi:IS30 family transposase
MGHSHVTDKQLPSIEYSLNHRPCKILGFMTPFNVFSELELSNVAGVALQT